MLYKNIVTSVFKASANPYSKHDNLWPAFVVKTYESWFLEYGCGLQLSPCLFERRYASTGTWMPLASDPNLFPGIQFMPCIIWFPMLLSGTSLVHVSLIVSPISMDKPVHRTYYQYM